MKFKELKKRVIAYHDALEVSNKIIYNKDKIIDMYEKQLAQQDYYIQRKDEEFNVLKRMYRDDIINGGLE